MPSPISQNATVVTNKTLTSWKEVAAYLGKGVRTVQRWEHQFGLPVRRPTPGSHVIFAITHELDAWVKQQQVKQQFKAPRPAPVIAARRMQYQQLANGLKTGITRLYENHRTLASNVVRLQDTLRQTLGRGNGQMPDTFSATSSGTT